jgi:hypothetical protein
MFRPLSSDDEWIVGYRLPTPSGSRATLKSFRTPNPLQTGCLAQRVNQVLDIPFLFLVPSDQQLGSTSPLFPFFARSTFILSACHCIFSGLFRGGRQICFFDAVNEESALFLLRWRSEFSLVHLL